MTHMGMIVLGLFLGAIYGWCTTNMIWPSCVALTWLGFSGYLKVGEAWTAGWGNATVIFCLFLMIIAALMEDSGLTSYLANWAISRKFTAGRPWALISVLFFSAFLCSAIVHQIPTVLIFWSICQSICLEAGYKKGDKLPALLCYGIVFICTIGPILLPFQLAVVSNFGFLFAASKGAITSFDFLTYLLYSVPMTAIIYVCFILFCKYIVRPDVSLLAGYKPKQENSTAKMSEKQKMSVGILIILVLVLMAPSYLPKGSLLGSVVNSLGNTGSVALVVGLVALLMYKGKPFVVIGELVHKGVAWGLLFMLATAFTLAGAINSPATGIIPYFNKVLGPVLSSGGTYYFIIAFLVITVITTNFINNVVVSAIMIPLSYGFCISMGINPMAVVAIFVFVVDYAILLPSASPAGGLMHSTDWVSKDRIYKWGFSSVLMLMVLTILIGWPLANIIF
jgi:Di- and tricarboxylate transporters